MNSQESGVRGQGSGDRSQEPGGNRGGSSLTPDSCPLTPDLDDPRVHHALEEYTAALEAGQRPDRQAFLARHADIAAVLAECLDGVDLVQTAAAHLPLPAVEGADPLLAAPLGDFEIVREVGRGGMGVVYEARQTSLGRRVALKVLPLAAALEPRHLQRFRNEAQAAAGLHHQHIVPVYGVGCERGVHYYAMQFIDGQPLSALIRTLREGDTLREGEAPAEPAQQKARQEPRPPQATEAAAGLSTQRSAREPAFFRAVAELGVQAAEALEHAHQTGIVHRDVKPANLMLDGRGQVWITDFGLARIQSDAGLTVTGDVLGTLRYMSPEQALGPHATVDQRTDVYGLGATLYELLTLHPVHDGQERQELLRQIEWEDPLPVRQRNAAVPVELETIVHKALAKSPAERYATAQELADDLQRFLDDKPIRARRPSLWERARRWLRRHQALAAAAVVVLAVAVVALAVSTALVTRQRNVAEANQKEAEEQRTIAQQNEAEAGAQRRRAEENLKVAFKAMDDICLPVLSSQLPRDPHLEREARALLQKALGFYQEFIARNRDARDLRPELASAYRRVGDIQGHLRQHAEAEGAFRAAAALWAELRDEFPDRADYRYALADTYRHFGGLLDADRRLPEAEKVLLQARDLCQELVGAFPQNPDYQQTLARSHLDLAKLFRVTGRVRDALAASRQALDIQSQLADAFPARQDIRHHLANCHANQGILFEEVGQPRQAEKDSRRAVELFQELLTQSPRHPEFRRGLARAQQHVGRLLMADGRMPQAEEAYDRARDVYQQLVHDFPNVPLYRSLLADCQRHRGMLLRYLSRLPEAEEALRHAQQLVQALVDGSPTAPEYRQDLAHCQYFLADVLAATGRGAAAEKAYSQAEALYQGLMEEFPKVITYRHQLASTCDKLGVLLTKTGRLEEAERLFGRSLTLRRQFEGPVAGQPGYRQHLAQTYKYLGNLLRAGRRFEEAGQAYREAVAIDQELVDRYPKNPLYRKYLAETLTDLAELRRDRGDFRQACQFLEQANHHWQAAIQLHPKDVSFRHFLGHSYLDLAVLLLRLGEHGRAAEVAAQLPPLIPGSWRNHVQAAALLAQGVLLAEKDARLTEAERPAVVQKYVDQARQNMRDAVAHVGDNLGGQYRVAWFLVTAVAPQVRDAGLALDLARQIVRRAPMIGPFWITLAAAHHRAGDETAARAALETAALLRLGGAAADWPFLALAHLAMAP